MKYLILTLLISANLFARVPYRKSVENEFIIKLKSPSYQKSFRAIKGFSKLELLDSTGSIFLAKTKKDYSLKAIKENFKNSKAIEYIEPNYIYHKISMDPLFNTLWGLHNTGDNEPSSSRGNSSRVGIARSDIDALKAWSVTKGNKRVKIAIIDTGLDYTHEDLKDNVWINTKELNGKKGVDDDNNGVIDDIHGYDFAYNDNDPMDVDGHGTHCAGTIGAVRNNLGIVGVMQKVSLVGIKFLKDDGSGSTSDAIRAINYAISINVDVMNNSWGGGSHSKALEDVIKKASQRGIIFIAAAGNDSSDNNSTPHYPSNYKVDNVISVAAHNYSDTLASFSNYGSRSVHVSAPGRNIMSTLPNNKYDVYSGTSMATPHVSGVVGLYIAKYGRIDHKTLKNLLMDSSVYVSSLGRKTISGGRVNAYNFLMEKKLPRPPKPTQRGWKKVKIQSFETDHPYVSNYRVEKTYDVPKAKFIRALVRKMDFEAGFDFLNIKQNGQLIERLTGKNSNFRSDYVEGSKITIGVDTDQSIDHWGVKIDFLEFQ